MDTHPRGDLDLDVEVLVDGDWVPCRAHQTRRGNDGQETFVSWEVVPGWPRVRAAWVRQSRIRPIHVAD